MRPIPGYPEGSGKKKCLSLNELLGPRRHPAPPPPVDLAVHLERILRSQSHGSAGSQLQQPNCGPEYTTPWVATGTHSL